MASLKHLLSKALETDKNNPNFSALKNLLNGEKDERELAENILALQNDAQVKNTPNKTLPRVLKILTSLANAELHNAHYHYDAMALLESISPSPIPTEPNTDTRPQLELEVSTQETRSLFRSIWSYIGNDFEYNYKLFAEEAKQFIKNKLMTMTETPATSKKLRAQSTLLTDTVNELLEAQIEVEKPKATNIVLAKELANTQAVENDEIMLLKNQLQHNQETLQVLQDHIRDYRQHVKTLTDVNGTLTTQNEQLKAQLKKHQQQTLSAPGRNSLLARSKSNSMPDITHTNTLKPN